VTVYVTRRQAAACAVWDRRVPAAETRVALVDTAQTARCGAAASTPPSAIPSPGSVTAAQPRAGTDHSAKSVSSFQLSLMPDINNARRKLTQ